MILHKIKAKIKSKDETITIEVHEDKILACKESVDGRSKLRWTLKNENSGCYEDIVKLMEYMENMLVQGTNVRIVIDESNQNMKDFAEIVHEIYNMIKGNLLIEKGSNTISKAYDTVGKFIGL